MDESTPKKLRLLPVVAALVVAAWLWWWLGAPSKTELIFTTGSADGLYHRLAQQIITVVEDAHPDIQINLRPSAGSRENISRLDDGEAHLALVQNDALGGKSVRSITALNPEILHLLCRTNAEIRSLHDLSGKRIGIGPAGSGTEQIVTNLLAFANLAAEPMPTRASFRVAIKKLKAGELDAAFFLAGLGAPVIGDALKDGHLALAPIHTQPGGTHTTADAQAEQFNKGFRVRYPHVSPHTIPLMAYAGWPTNAIPSLGVQAVLVCRNDVPVDVVERITRILFKQRAVLSQKEPAFVRTNAELIALSITGMLVLWSGLTWTRRWFVQSRKNRIDSYYQAVDDIIHRLQDGTDLDEINGLESELLKIRQRASEDLVKEQLAADESYIIYQNMLNGCQAMLVRMREKIQASPEKDA